MRLGDSAPVGFGSGEIPNASDPRPSSNSRFSAASEMTAVSLTAPVFK